MKFKRFQCCILALIAVLMLAVFPVSAAEILGPPWQMPLEMGQQLPEGVQEAAVALREGMKRLENIISVSFYVDAASFDGSEQAADELAEQVQSLALAHTGVPNEGDYLLGLLAYNEILDVAFVQSGDGWQINADYYYAYLSNAEQEAELDVEIARLVEFLDLKGDATDYQKITAIYNYICTNVRYDYEHKNDASYALKQTAYAAAVHKTAVCQGYATLLYRLALEAGVDCRYITGYAGEGHAWNLVKVDGQYYYLDSTWDEGTFQYGYFLKSASDFWDHEPDDRYLTEEFQAAHPIAQQSYQHPSLDGVTEDGFVYRVINGIAILTGYSGTAKDVVVPVKADGYPLCEVAPAAFCWNDTVESITFSEGIRILNSSAIWNCDNLKSVHFPSTVDFTGSKDPDYPCNNVWGPSQCPSVETITVAEGNPNVVVVDNVLYSKDMTILRYFPAADPREVFEIPEGVVSIGAGAFQSNRNLKEVIMPDTVRMINFGAFQGSSNLEEINISNSCRQIGQYVFEGTAIEYIHIPASVEFLGAGSFGEGSKLKTITVDPENPYFYVEDGALYATYVEGINADSCHIAGKWLVKYPVGSDATSCTVPDGVVGIEWYAFSNGTNLEEIVLPDGVTSIGERAFYGCSGLTNITIPDSVTSIGNGAFAQCSNLMSIVISDGVTSISHTAFVGCSSLTSVVIPDSVTSIGNSAFYECSSLKSIVIPDSVTSIGPGAFYGCRNLTDVYITDITAWLSIDFHGDDSSSPLYNSLNLTGNKLYLNGELLTDLVIPEGVTSIGDYAFYRCSNLTSVVIPDGVTSIGYLAFDGCSSLTSVVIPDSVTSIGNLAFQTCSNLTSVVIPDSVTSIGSSAFNLCTALESVVLPDSVTSIDDRVFSGCSSLTSVVIPNSVTSIGDSAFSGCSSLTSVVIPNGVTSIGDYAFSFGSALTSVVIPDSVTSIGDYVFQYCSALTSVMIPDSVTSIGSGAFCECSALTSVMIPDSVTSIGGDAFWRCSRLTSVVIPDSVTSIGGYAFYNCDSLSIIYFMGDAPVISDTAFGNNDSTSIVATVYYPLGNSTWTEEVKQNYGGTITWEGYKVCAEHAYSAVVTVPTCTEKGFTIYTCTICGKSYVGDKAEATGHSYETTVTAPTCTEKGFTTYTCTICGKSHVSDKVEATGHSYEATVTGPTCSKRGFTTYTCTVCGDSYADDYVDPLGHKFENEVCTVCGRPDRIPGDIDGNEGVDVDDVLALLWNVLFPDDYPIEAEADFDDNGVVDVDDVLTLLWHVLFPEDYPL